MEQAKLLVWQHSHKDSIATGPDGQVYRVWRSEPPWMPAPWQWSIDGKLPMLAHNMHAPLECTQLAAQHAAEEYCQHVRGVPHAVSVV